MDKSNEFYLEIAKVAYEIYEKRGSHGKDHDDWLETERIVTAKPSQQTLGKKVSAAFEKKAGKQN